MQEFESSVVLDGTKTIQSISMRRYMFESSVVLDGTKTIASLISGIFRRLYVQRKKA